MKDGACNNGADPSTNNNNLDPDTGKFSIKNLKLLILNSIVDQLQLWLYQFLQYVVAKKVFGNFKGR